MPCPRKSNWALFRFSAGSLGAETKIALQQQSICTLRRLEAASAMFAAGDMDCGAAPSIRQHDLSTLRRLEASFGCDDRRKAWDREPWRQGNHRDKAPSLSTVFPRRQYSRHWRSHLTVISLISSPSEVCAPR